MRTTMRDSLTREKAKTTMRLVWSENSDLMVARSLLIFLGVLVLSGVEQTYYQLAFSVT